jgi:hypothetical protein
MGFKLKFHDHCSRNPEQPTNDDLLLAKQAVVEAFKEINADQSRGLEHKPSVA